MLRTSSDLCLTDSYISSLPYANDSSKRVEHRDSVLLGLVLRIGKCSKTFYLVRTASGRLIKHKLGRFPGMGVERARALAETCLKGEVRIRVGARTRPLTSVESFPDVELLTTEEAARLTKMSMAWFERKRWEGLGPPYYRRGRTVRYVKQELLEWWLTAPAAGEIDKRLNLERNAGVRGLRSCDLPSRTRACEVVNTRS